ncbi:hypothetical protein V3C33_15210 [Micrococcaceae bacterium Sec5.7]
MRTLARGVCIVLAVVAFTLGIAACDQGPASHAGFPDTLWNAATVDPLQPAGLLPDEHPQPVHLVPTYRSGDEVGAWRLLETGDGGKQLVIRYSQAGECQTDKGVIVVETSTEVAIVPVYRNPATPCQDVAALQTPSGIVDLAQPLGNRKLLHIPGDNAFS